MEPGDQSYLYFCVCSFPGQEMSSEVSYAKEVHQAKCGIPRYALKHTQSPPQSSRALHGLYLCISSATVAWHTVGSNVE